MPKKKKQDTEEEIQDMINDLPSNSMASKKVAPMREERAKDEQEEVPTIEDKPRREPRAIRRKKTFAQSVARGLFGNMANGMMQQVMQNVLVPAAKDMFQEMVQSFIDVLLYGEARPGNRRDRDKGKTVISYGKFYRPMDDDRTDNIRRRTPDKFGLEDIYFKTPKAANDALSELCDQLEEYEWVTVADYFDIIGMESPSWIADKWGWNDLRKAKCRHAHGGYIVVLPDPEPLE